jgi:hypothetical protein
LHRKTLLALADSVVCTSELGTCVVGQTEVLKLRGQLSPGIRSNRK